MAALCEALSSSSSSDSSDSLLEYLHINHNRAVPAHVDDDEDDDDEEEGSRKKDSAAVSIATFLVLQLMVDHICCMIPQLTFR